MQPLPTKVRTSFDIPKLLSILTTDGTYQTSATFGDLMTVRNYMLRHNTPYRLSQTAIKNDTNKIIGYTLRLRTPHDRSR